MIGKEVVTSALAMSGLPAYNKPLRISWYSLQHFTYSWGTKIHSTFPKPGKHRMPYKQIGRGICPSASAKPEYMILAWRNNLDEKKGFNSPHSLERKKQKHWSAVNTAVAERPRLWPIVQQYISQHTAFQRKSFPLPLPFPRPELPPH